MIRPSHIFAAVLATSSAGAIAQSVNISGVLDEFVAVTHTGGQDFTRLDSNGLMASRLVFSGLEDLGNGLKAKFFLENGFSPDTGAQSDPTRLFNRQAYVGLISGLGEFRLGRLTSPQFFMEGQFDAFQGATMGSGFNNLVTYSVRFDNSVAYITPATLGPFKVQAVASLNEGFTGRRVAATVAGVEYKDGPLYLGANYANVQDARTLAVTKTGFAGGNYAFGPAKVFVGYFQAKTDNGSLNRQTLGLSGQYSVSPTLVLVAGYARANDKTAANADGSQISAGFFQDLSRRTMLYGNVSKLSNKRTAAFSLNTATALGVVPQPGNGVTGVQFGIRHLF